MTDDSKTEAKAKAEARADEAAAIRRRWITLGEVLTVIAVTISGLTLWNNWSQRSETEASRSADARRASTRAAMLVLTASGSGDDLGLKPASADQSVQSQHIAFPSALALPPAETTGEPRIEAAWFERALKKARKDANLSDDSRGDERLPVLVTTRFLVDGASHEDIAIYDIGYSISGHWLGGHSITLRGVSLVSHVGERQGQAALDVRWKKNLPPEPAADK
ncbi:MAG: hypothetical protein J7530_03455 [Novosphingobium sp.]|nr:hypothetical protein [Novosphingobium sp.]